MSPHFGLIRGPLIEEVEVEPRREEEVGPSNSSGKKDTKTETTSKEVPIEVEEEIEVEPLIIMDSNGEKKDPPPIPPVPPVDPLVRPRGLPILVPQNLVELDMPSNLPKFYETRDDDRSDI